MAAIPLSYAMIGGGPGSMIGEDHRGAAEHAGFQLNAGVFSRNIEKNRALASQLGVAPERTYASYVDLIRSEAFRPDGVETLIIVTPNNTHFEIASAALKSGLNVICDKPLTLSLEQADTLRCNAARKGLFLTVTHEYPFFPGLRLAASLVKQKEIGRVRRVNAVYRHGLFTPPIKEDRQAQAAWRLDPEQGGAGGVVHDIGVHMFHLANTILSATPSYVRAQLDHLPGRHVYDIADIQLAYEDNVEAFISISQVATEPFKASILLNGENGDIYWRIDDANAVTLRHKSASEVRIVADDNGSPYTESDDEDSDILEAFKEAFSSYYSAVAQVLISGTPKMLTADLDYAINALGIVEGALASHTDGGGWRSLD